MVERWNPAAEVDRLLGEMDRFFTQTTPRVRAFARAHSFSPAIDLYDSGDQLVLRALIPGAAPEDIDVTLEQNVLTISGRYGAAAEQGESRTYTWYRREIGSGQFAESVAFPFPVDADQIQAAFEHGLLTLTMPKAEQARAKRIPVQQSPQMVEAGS